MECRQEDFDNLGKMEFYNDSDSEEEENEDEEMGCYLPKLKISPKGQTMDLMKSIGGYKSECSAREVSEFEIDWDEEELTSFE